MLGSASRRGTTGLDGGQLPVSSEFPWAVCWGRGWSPGPKIVRVKNGDVPQSQDTPKGNKIRELEKV